MPIDPNDPVMLDAIERAKRFEREAVSPAPIYQEPIQPPQLTEIERMQRLPITISGPQGSLVNRVNDEREAIQLERVLQQRDLTDELNRGNQYLEEYGSVTMRANPQDRITNENLGTGRPPDTRTVSQIKTIPSEQFREMRISLQRQQEMNPNARGPVNSRPVGEWMLQQRPDGSMYLIPAEMATKKRSSSYEALKNNPFL